jgi:hypothetical protein
MTLDDVREAVASLKAAGRQPSHRAILAHVGGTSKRRVAELVHALLAAAPDALTMPAPAPRGRLRQSRF